MSFKEYFKNEHLSLSQLFEKLKKANPQVQLRKQCIAVLKMPEVTFWYKLRENKFTPEEKELIASTVDRPIADLFPN